MNKITNVLMRSFVTNILLSLVKIISGVIGSSGALIADGLHSLSDTLTDVFAIIGNKLSSKPADDKHPFGHGKIEYITCIVIGIIVMMMGITIIYRAMFEPKVIPSLYVAIVSFIVILAKFVLAKYLLHKGNQYKSNILTASGRESLSDVISSLVVFVSILISQFGFVYADMIAMIIVGVLILKIAYHIFKENFSSLIGEQVTDNKYLTEIKKIIKKEKEVIDVDLLIILKYGHFYQVNCEVSMRKDIVLKEAHDVLDRIEERLKKYDNSLKHIIIHINPYDD